VDAGPATTQQIASETNNGTTQTSSEENMRYVLILAAVNAPVPLRTVHPSSTKPPGPPLPRIMSPRMVTPEYTYTSDVGSGNEILPVTVIEPEGPNNRLWKPVAGTVPFKLKMPDAVEEMVPSREPAPMVTPVPGVPLTVRMAELALITASRRVKMAEPVTVTVPDHTSVGSVSGVDPRLKVIELPKLAP
jgi:hypothetical protein